MSPVTMDQLKNLLFCAVDDLNPDLELDDCFTVDDVDVDLVE